MLDSETKRRIDTARDILVGKVPDPKSQVEQITIALIYKFMDDMDAEAEEFGGKRKFFVGEYEKFSWAKLLSPALGGAEMLNLYSEAIEKMTRNQNVQQLFRDIFKNAYLPYRDPETLKLFLKTINEFSYDHSERLGDAFEYLLSVLGSQGDAGQFRTPRHIIDFMVKVVDPQKTDTILDPACGTAGFLISAYKHVLASNARDGKPGAALTPDERARLANNIRGYDISPDMVRLSLVNLYLHGFNTPNIFEYDTLTSEERWGEYADVILANPPFMSPKGGIKPHKRFSVQSNRSEVLFVDYMAEHLTPTGRAAIIVPEGIIFQSGTAYKQLRKYLVEQNYLWAVVSLPAGAFNPYSGVKTSILLLDRVLAKKTDQVLFVKVEADGFDLGAQRRPVERDDLPQTYETLKAYKATLLEENPASFAPLPDSALLVPVSRLVESDYNLSIDRYRSNHVVNTVYEMIPVGHFMKSVPTIDPRSNPEELFELWSIPAYDAGNPEILFGKDIGSQKKSVSPGDILISRIIPHIRRALVVPPNDGRRRQIASTEWIVFSGEAINPGYLRQILLSDLFNKQFMQTITGVGGSLQRANPQAVSEITIPIPSLETQRQIVNEIAAHQRIIDGARQVVEGWKPRFDIDTEWELVKLGDVAETSSGGTPLRSKLEYYDNGAIPWVKSGEVAQGFVIDAEEKITELGLKNSSAKIFPKNTVLVAMYGATAGQVGLLKIEAATNQAVCGIFPNDKFVPEYLYLVLKTKTDYMVSISSGGAQPNISQTIIRQLEIPLPPLEIQREIVGRIERERAIVEGNRELIRLYEEKVKKVIERVWEG